MSRTYKLTYLFCILCFYLTTCLLATCWPALFKISAFFWNNKKYKTRRAYIKGTKVPESMPGSLAQPSLYNETSFDVGDDCSAGPGMDIPGHAVPASSGWLYMVKPPFAPPQIASLWWPLLKAFTCCFDSALMLKYPSGYFLGQLNTYVLFSKPLDTLWQEQQSLPCTTWKLHKAKLWCRREVKNVFMPKESFSSQQC